MEDKIEGRPEQVAEKRTGGNVETRGQTQSPTPTTDRGDKRTGGNVETRGAGGKADKPSPAD